jgi:hypothetical protein
LAGLAFKILDKFAYALAGNAFMIKFIEAKYEKFDLVDTVGT